ncbi:hypothetical protein KUTeg_024065 [Tegillarca granosa]|uniref:Uncharacterized protein n=1 Tax=Tegillarca granosa TaxID=220873 RepID=A0ABQ9DWU5_TEGGR|nr:hypothetical protein KUTeg_024065 [Tegillarca granosa]
MGTFKTQMLWDSIRKGDLTASISLLENRTINLEERDENGQTFLMSACEFGELNIVRELLEAGVDPNAVDNDNWTALLCASREGHLEIVIELLEKGADIEHRDLLNMTCLAWAAGRGHTECVKMLLQKGAKVNNPDKVK